MSETFPPTGYIQTNSAVSGITVYKPQLDEEAHQPIVAFHCPHCDGATAYCAVDGGLTCTYCGYYEPPSQEVVGREAERFEFTVETMHRVAHGWGIDRLELACNRCGVHSTLPANSLTHTCAFCGSNSVVQTKAPQDVLRPRYLIPLTINADTCRQRVAQWLESSWMLPQGLTRLARSTEFVPVYVPFWTFDADTVTHWRAEVGQLQKRREGKMVWEWESGHVYTQLDGLLVSGTSKVERRMLKKIEPFQLEALVPYDANYLAGVQAQAYDVSLEAAWQQARKRLRHRVKTVSLTKTSSKKIRNFSMTVDYSNESWRYILLPIYLATYRYGNKSYQVMLNGQTGAVAGQRPVDWRKIWSVVALLLAPGTLLFILGVLLGDAYSGLTFLGVLLSLAAGAGAIYLVQKASQLEDV